MKLSFPTFLAAALVSCAHAVKPRVRMTPKSAGKAGKTSAPGVSGVSGALYTMTNQPENEILVYSRDVSHGQLTFSQSVSTNGSGSTIAGNSGPPTNIALPPIPAIDPLTSQSAILVAGNCLLNVNAGSDEVSTFKIIDSTEIQFAGVFGSGGLFPVSIAERDGLVYVLNAGGNGSIQGYTLSQFNCGLRSLGDPVVMDQGGGLSSDASTPFNPPFGVASPAQIGFIDDGHLLVTVKALGGGQNYPLPGVGGLVVFAIHPTTGMATYPSITEITGRPGSAPFSFDFDHEGRLLLVELFGEGFQGDASMGFTPAAGSGGLSVWEFDGKGTFTEVSMTSTTQFLTCWLEYIPQNHCVYTANSGQDSLSAFNVDGGADELVDSTAATDLSGPLDLVASPDGNFLYVLSPDVLGITGHTGQPQVVVYKTSGDCHLTQVQAIEDGLETEEARRAAADGVLNGVLGLAVWGP